LTDRTTIQASVDAVRARLGEAEFQAAWSAGAAQPLDGAIDAALARGVLA
jgi:hypothetical protein